MIGLQGESGLVYVLRVMYIGGSLVESLAQDAPERAATFAEVSEAIEAIAQEDAEDASLVSEYVADGLLGLPGGHIYDENGRYRMVFCPLGDCIIMLSAQPWDDTVETPALEGLTALLSIE